MNKLILAAGFTICLIVLSDARTTRTTGAQPQSVTTLRTREGALEEAGNQRAMAVKLFSESKYDEAIAAAKRAADLSEQADGRDGTETAKAISLLASYYDFTGHAGQAETLYRRAVSVWEKRPGAESTDYFDALRRYACLLHRKGRREDAEKYGGRASKLGARLNVWEDATEAEGDHSEGRLNRAAVNKPQPSSPGAAHPAQARGTVEIEIIVDEGGNVILACAKSGPRELQDVSERAAYGWRFKPTLLSGVPVKVSGTLAFKFEQ